MIKNNNGQIINKLLMKNMLSHKRRTIMTFIAMILTCLMLTTVFTVAASLIKSMEYTMAMQVGTSGHIGFKQVEASAVDALTSHESIEAYGVSTIIGRIEDERYLRRPTEVRTMDDQYMEMGFLLPLQGKKPEKYNEIVIDAYWLELFKLPKELNQSLEVTMLIGEEHITESFQIVGISQGNIQGSTSFLIVSDEFKKAYVTDKVGPNYLGGNDITIMLSSKFGLEEKAIKIIEDSGFDPGEIHVGFNWAYINSLESVNIGDIISYAVLIIMLMISGYLLIYNIYLIAITKDIKFYGLLNTIGATSGQIRLLVYKQGMVLYLLSLLPGLLLGYAFGLMLMPFITDVTTDKLNMVSTNLGIFVFSAALTLVTVLVSCTRPARIAGRVSPIEAIRSTEVKVKSNTKKIKSKAKKRKSGNKLYRMAWINMFRSKRKAFLVILSLSMSLAIFSGVLILLDTIDINERLSRSIGSDYLIAEAKYFHYNYQDESVPESLQEELDAEVHAFHRYEGEWTLSEQQKTMLYDQIMNFDDSYYSHNRIKEGLVKIEMYSTDAFILDALSDYLIEGEIPNELSSDEIILEKDIMVADNDVNLELKIGEKINVDGKTYEVVAFVYNMPAYLYDQSFSGGSVQSFVSESKGPVMSLMVNGHVDKEKIERQYPMLTVKSRDDYKDDLKSFILLIKVIGYSLSVFLGLIGAMNFSNMMLTSIVVRKREFAIMQSIGMTSKQFKTLLLFEGFYIVSLSTIIAITISGILATLTMETFSFLSLLPVCLMSLFLFVLLSLILLFAYLDMEKESIVERLNTVE